MIGPEIATFERKLRQDLGVTFKASQFLTSSATLGYEAAAELAV